MPIFLSQNRLQSAMATSNHQPLVKDEGEVSIAIPTALYTNMKSLDD